MKKALLSFFKDLLFVVIGAYLGAYASGDFKVDASPYLATGSSIKSYFNKPLTFTLWQLFLWIAISLFLSRLFERFRRKHYRSPIWSEQVGLYSFKEMSEILKHDHVDLPFHEQTPKDRHNLYYLFKDYYSYMRDGVYRSDNTAESDMLIEVLGPLWADYNLVVVEPCINTKRYEYHDIRLYVTGVGQKLYSLMQKAEISK